VTRHPDFIIIGAMKAGTTTLFRWLGEHPSCCLPAQKEPAFFARDDRWELGIDWYESLFPDDGCLTGEASVVYTDPRFAGQSAERIAALLPDVRLVFIARHPVERARSHYIHQVVRGREVRPYTEAVSSADNPYTERSRYFSVLLPYLKRFDSTQVAIIWFEEMFARECTSEWGRLLEFLGVPFAPRPEGAHNRTDSRIRLTGGGRWLWDHGFRTVPSWVPKVLRGFAHRVLTSPASSNVERLMLSADAEVAGSQIDLMWEDVDRFLVETGSARDRWR
jgi:hypothetical protein